MRRFVLILLTFVLILPGQPGSLSTAGPGAFKDYRLEYFPLVVRLPQSTEVVVDHNLGHEILFNAHLHDATLDYWGYIQVWQMPDLDAFLSGSEEQSLFYFASYSRQAVRLEGFDGILLEWTQKKEEGALQAKEYFLRGSPPETGRVLRISFFTARDEFPPQLKQFALVKD